MAKYDSITKRERNNKLKLFAEAHPELSLKEIGEVFIRDDGKPLSATRVWQIIKKGGRNE